MSNINIPINKTNNWRVFSFCLIIIQSIGIRFFHGQGTFLSIVIILLSFKALPQLSSKDYKFLFFSFFFLFISKFVNPEFSFSNLLYQISLVISTYLFIVRYRKTPDLLQLEFYKALKIFSYHATIGYVIYLLLPKHFMQINIMNKSFLYLFYISGSEFIGLRRNTGLFWEPGLLQLAANLYLFYCIKFNHSIYRIILGALLVISTFSTIGFIILILNFLYFFYKKITQHKLSIRYIGLIVVSLFLFIPIFKENITDKLGGKNTSGLVRFRDLLIGIELIKEKPIVGHGIFNVEYLTNKNYTNNIESTLFSPEYIKSSGDMGGGYTNGLLGIFAWYGLPVSLFLLFCYFKNKFIDRISLERLLFCLIPLLSMISEPIAYTSFFLMFPFSYWILKDSMH